MTVMDDGGLPGPVGLLPGTLLLDTTWLAGRIRATGALYDCRDARVNATLWWYSASTVLLGRAVHELVLLGRGTGLAPVDLRILPGPAGLQRVVPGPPLPPGEHAFGEHLDQALAPVIDVLTRTAPVTARSLWALTADSLATRLLAEVRDGSPDDRAAAITAGSRLLRPAPRFVRIAAAGVRTSTGQEREAAPGSTPVAGAGTYGADSAAVVPVSYVHRVSCCLLRRVPAGVCVSCPAQHPDERLLRLQAYARSSSGRA